MRVATNRGSLNVSNGKEVSVFISILKNFVLLIRYTFLVGVLFLFAGYDAANPKIGNTSVEFYSSQFRGGLLEVLKQNNIEPKVILSDGGLVDEFYNLRQNMPAWTLNFNVNNNYLNLYSILNSARNYGLTPTQYSINKLEELESLMTNSEDDNSRLKARIEFEMVATQSALRYITHISAGVRNADTTSIYNKFRKSLPASLNAMVNENRVKKGILGFQPDNREYIRLQRALKRYLSKSSKDTVSYSTEELKSNRNLVSARLCNQGFLDKSFINDSVAIQIALENFQRAHNLDETGELNKATLLALTLSTKDKFKKIAINLDRLRKDDLKNKNCVMVNIPEFRLHYYNPSGEYKSFNVVVGKKKTPTPLLSSQIEYIIANPYWTVPTSITFNEFLPKIRKDSLYLQHHGYAVVDKFNNPVDASRIDWNSVNPGDFKYWIRQPNGTRNALGVVKFLFPNKYSVYLHDTQSKKLFNHRIRAYSHGCIRVQNPEELAQNILDDYSSHKRDKNIDFNQLICKKDRVELKLDESIPVYIRYYTCTADTLGNIYYHPDIYNKDDASMEEITAYLSWD